jgi:hypothetical protein
LRESACAAARPVSAILFPDDFSMNDILNKATVLVLNRNWQAIRVKTPAEAFCVLATGAGAALDRCAERRLHHAREHPARPRPRADCHRRREFAKVPLRRPQFGARGIWERDGGVCQYTGRKLSPKEGNIDHVIPRSRGGKTSWG